MTVNMGIVHCSGSAIVGGSAACLVHVLWFSYQGHSAPSSLVFISRAFCAIFSGFHIKGILRHLLWFLYQGHSAPSSLVFISRAFCAIFSGFHIKGILRHLLWFLYQGHSAPSSLVFISRRFCTIFSEFPQGQFPSIMYPDVFKRLCIQTTYAKQNMRRVTIIK